MTDFFRKTGSIWQRTQQERTQIINAVCQELEIQYGQPRLDNPDFPVDDLVFIIISNKTTPQTAKRAYYAVRDRFASWQDVLLEPAAELREVIRSAGLADIKTSQIYGALTKIASDFGACSLQSLERISTEQQLAYLITLPGVSGKVARCIMLYTLGAQVLPVDSHVHRIARRLGWTARKRADQSHEELETLVPETRRFAFHVDCILHGRAMCRPREPWCEKCCISQYCKYSNDQESNDIPASIEKTDAPMYRDNRNIL